MSFSSGGVFDSGTHPLLSALAQMHTCFQSDVQWTVTVLADMQPTWMSRSKDKEADTRQTTLVVDSDIVRSKCSFLRLGSAVGLEHELLSFEMECHCSAQNATCFARVSSRAGGQVHWREIRVMRID